MAARQPDIHIAVELPATPVQSSVTSIQRNADGQIGMLATTGVHILTPAVGIKYDVASADVAIVPALQKAGREPLRLFRAIADASFADHILWANETFEPGGTVLGSVMIQCKDFTWSPPGSGKDGTCLLAILTTNLEVFMYRPAKNYLNGEWTRIGSMTTALLQDPNEVSTNGSSEGSPLRRVLQAQTTSLSWSGAVWVPGLSSSKNLSLLALGSRAGTVSFWRYDSVNCWSRQAMIVISEEWVTHLSWAGWLQIDPQTVSSSVACGLSDGSIRLVTVFQKISPNAFGEVQAFLTPMWATSPDSRSLTALKWVDLQAYPRYVLAYAKPGLLGLVSPVGSGLGWMGERRLVLSRQLVHAGSSAVGTPSGIDYFAADDALLVTYSDGTIQVVHRVSTDPTLEMAGSQLKSLDITRTMRRACMEIEGPGPTDVTVMETLGCCFVSDGIALWSYQTAHPTFLDYVPELSQVTTLTMATIVDLRHDPALALQSIEALCSIAGPQALGLRPRLAQKRLSIYLDLEANPDSEDLRNGLSRLLDVSAPEWTDAARNRVVPTWSVPDTDDKLREQLRMDLVDGSDVTLLRSKLAILQQADIFGYSFAERVSFAQSLIVAHVFGAYLYAAADPNSLVMAHDTAFVQRIIKISKYLPVSINTAKSLTEALAQTVGVKLDDADGPAPEPDVNDRIATMLVSSVDVGDVCMVCKSSMPMTNLERARCENGHVWERCSITTFPLATPNVRTCVGCGRKAHLPPSELSGKSRVTHSWFVDLVLETVNSCLCCGNHFVQIL